jgi:hypothetical protein
MAADKSGHFSKFATHPGRFELPAFRDALHCICPLCDAIRERIASQNLVLLSLWLRLAGALLTICAPNGQKEGAR